MLKLEAGWAQTVGKRDYQQDGVAKMIWPSGFALLVLSDGMGGAVHGEIASQQILSSFSNAFCDSDAEQIAERLRDSLQATNQHLSEYIAEHEECQGMGGTLVAAAFTGNNLDWLSVGDSPLWLIRDKAIVRINQDHSKKAELLKMVASGLMTAEEAAVHPQRNQLTSAVMGYSVDYVDIDSMELKNGDIVLLASDGVETISETDLASMCHRFQHSEPQILAEHIVSYVDNMAKPYQDNATVMVLKITGQLEQEENAE